ncbi:MAG: hypothetical protein M3R04_10505 [bacterium]|nr:hypothetical protein [bacterium]
MSKESRTRLREGRSKSTVPGWVNVLWLLLLAFGVYVIIQLAGAGDLAKLADEPLTLALVLLLGVLVLFAPFTAFIAARGRWRRTLQVVWFFALACTLIELIHHSHIAGQLAIHGGPRLGPLGTLWEVGLGVAALLPFISMPRMSALWPFRLMRKGRTGETAVAA